MYAYVCIYASCESIMAKDVVLRAALAREHKWYTDFCMMMHAQSRARAGAYRRQVVFLCLTQMRTHVFAMHTNEVCVV